MSNVFAISDLHLDHRRILEFSPSRGGSNIDEHNEWLVAQWNSVVQKRDVVYVLGDVAFSKESMGLYLPRMKGQKFLVRGNHDKFDPQLYLQHFANIYGIIKKHGYWMSHAPIHPQELREKRNIHGHVHSKTIPDDRYINVCVEALNGVPLCLEDIK